MPQNETVNFTLHIKLLIQKDLSRTKVTAKYLTSH